jgi:hypothetical protein
MKTKVNGVAGARPVLVSPGAERSEGERSEAERSAASGEIKTPPDPEVVVRAQRRQFTGEYKKHVLAEAESAHEPGAIGALLRREGLYSSHLTHWRQQRDLGLAPHRRGPKAKHYPDGITQAAGQGHLALAVDFNECGHNVHTSQWSESRTFRLLRVA